MDLETHLADVPFVVVDLETTGGSPADCRITEFGAVRIAGGEVQGEFASLVDPGVAIPPSITALTGISDGLVAQRPPVEAVLPAFLEFCRGAVLVAHNARFDLAFLNANLERLAYPALDAPVVCTALLARRLVREEVRDCRLSTLAAHFRCRTEPVHRALPDARATVEVFHGLLERAGSFGVLTLEGLLDFTRVRDAALFRSKRHLADGLPAAPGVYRFRSASGEVLYVGKAADLRARVRSYFGSDDRRTVVDMLKEAAEVEHTVCPTPVEAAVRELRLLRAHRPRFNRRAPSKSRQVWVKLTAERFPRLSIVRARRDDGGAYLGPLASRRTAQLVVDALHDIAPLRRCTLPLDGRRDFAPCVLAEISRCLSPCDHTVGEHGYAVAAALVRSALEGDPTVTLTALAAKVAARAGADHFEQAADARDRLSALATAVQRSRRVAALRAAGLLIASRPSTGGQVDVVHVRDGLLVASARGTVAPPPETDPGEDGGADETDLLARWLEGPGTVVHACSGTYAISRYGGRVVEAHANLRPPPRPRAADELASKRLRRIGTP